MKPTRPLQENLSEFPRHPRVAYLFLVRPKMASLIGSIDLLADFIAWPDLILIGIIMLFCGLPYVVVIAFIAARKGQSVPLFCILCFIPIVNVVAGLWLASLTDATVKDRLAKLEGTSPEQL